MVESNKTYVGIVEDNIDPKKMGRVRVRVMDVFDEIPVEDIPWAMPWKDLNGNQFNTPEKGKVVMVIFDSGNEENPEFIYADHYNINLENKLKTLSDGDYTSMKSLIFDHKTQIYVNDTEGLKIDYKYNNINIIDNSLNLNLKDNNANLNLGDSTADQQAILGNHFLDWFGNFLNTLQAGGLFNAGGPALPNPALLKLITEFTALKELKYLSHHVNIVDNNKITTVGSDKREDNPQYGDEWTSTKDENTLTKKTEENFIPKDGPNEEYNKPVSNDSTQIAGGTASQNQSSETSQANDTNSTDSTTNNTSTTTSNTDTLTNTTSNATNAFVEKLIRFLESKKYKVYRDVNVLNLVAMRNKDNGTITNKFDENFYVFYMNIEGDWELKTYAITTVPGLKGGSLFLPDKVNILAPGQYIDQCKFANNNSDFILKFENCVVYKNNSKVKYNYLSTTQKINNLGLSIRKSSSSGISEYVGDYSPDGSQVFKNANQYSQFIKLCKNQLTIKNTFTYTLCNKSDFNKFV